MRISCMSLPSMRVPPNLNSLALLLILALVLQTMRFYLIKTYLF